MVARYLWAWRMSAGARLWPWWVLWLMFVVYGSLVPLDFQAVPPDVAWQRLVNAPMLRLGIESRADWVANGVLYFPVGLLTAAVFSGGRQGNSSRWLAAVLSVAFGTTLAVVVEFAQVFCPPRTVSRNDLLAEGVGTMLGALAAVWIAPRLRMLLDGFQVGGIQLARRLAPAYALVYVGLAMFPFDLLLDLREWRDKLHGPSVAWWLAGQPDAGGSLGGLAKLAIEVLLTLPLGAWWCTNRSVPTAQVPWGRSLLIGALLGVALEGAQLAIASGVSQGASMATRAVGFSIGAAAALTLRHRHIESWRAAVRRWSLPVLMVYLPMMALHSGWWRGDRLTLDRALDRLQTDVHFLPFYYHYFTTEMRAVVSLTSVGLSYAMVSVLSWGWHQGALIAGVLAAAVAVAMETGKLFAGGSHPDPTNVLIAGLAAGLGHILLTQLTSLRIPVRTAG